MEGKSVHTIYINKSHALNINTLGAEGPYKKCIMDNGADTSVIGKGWFVIAHTQRKANVVCFDKKAAVKRASQLFRQSLQ